MQPPLCFRYHDKIPRALVLKAIECIRSGVAQPAFFNDKMMVPYLLEKGMPLADARDYAISNCMSWVIPGKDMVYRQGMGMFSFTNCMMLALNQGVDWLSGQKAGVPTPDPLTYKSIDDIIEATMQQFNFYMEKGVYRMSNLEEDQIGRIKKLVIKEKGIRPGIKMFRCTRERRLVLINEEVHTAFVKAGLTGFKAVKAEGWNGAIGALVDAAIVVVEQTHKNMEQWERTGRKEDYKTVVINAVKQVAGPSFFALLVIAVSFLPVLTLEAHEGRLFKPLAYTKNLSMIIAAVLAITLDPALRLFLTHMKNFNFRPTWLCRATNAVAVGTIHSEEKHPISRVLIRLYEPVAAWTLRWKKAVIAAAFALVIVTIPVYLKLGSEFMPPLEDVHIRLLFGIQLFSALFFPNKA